MTNRHSLLSFLSLLALALGACGDDTVDPEQFSLEWCTAYDDWDTRCGDTPTPGAIDECRMDPEIQCFAAAIRPDLTSPMIACINDLSCDTSDDECYAAEGLGEQPSAAALAFRARCLALRDTCTEFSNDFCFLDILSDETIEAADACLDGACGDVRDCFDAAIFGGCS